MLSDWLDFDFQGNPQFKKFSLIEADEKVKLSPEIQSYLKNLILEARFDPKMINAVKRYNWKKCDFFNFFC